MNGGTFQIPKVPIFGVGVSVTDYTYACAEIIDAARAGRSYAVSALATHGLTEAARDHEFGRLVNSIELVTPDGQPVRWAMNILHGTALAERVYGPKLVAAVCAAAAAERMSVYLFGSTPQTCRKVAEELPRRYPGLRVAGVQPDRFREATADEDTGDVQRIRASGADIVLVGRGCPRQERWVAQHRGLLHVPMLAVGAAFDYIAGNIARPPGWMQRIGLEWLFRLYQEPRRLFRRYLVHNSLFCIMLVREVLKKRRTTASPR
jgi:N-acetylglucosaminyldiphosphoundecaprenol N-acetyl-beta-D-mannosaminyltransferase